MDNTSNVLMQRYELGRLLGQGTFGKVYYARSAISNLSVAIKVIDKDKVLRARQAERIKREISIMRLVKHPNTIQLFEVMATRSKIYFVIEYAKGGELFDNVAKGMLKEEVAHKYFRQLINAVDFCHSREVYHRDIKPENLLLDENENLKVSDFGLSALAESKRQDGLLHTTCGTPAYVAPEVIKMKGYDGAKADIWSCGVVLYVLLAGYLPFHDSNLIEMYKKISKAEFTCPSWFPSNVRRLFSKMLDPNLDTRISIAKIKESSWFRKGPHGRQKKLEGENNAVAPAATNSADQSHESDVVAGEARQKPDGPTSINAFDIISLSSGINLCGLSGPNARQKKLEGENNAVAPAATNSADQSHESDGVAGEARQKPDGPTSINAFDIISLSSGINLCGFFEDNYEKTEARFTSRQTFPVIISKLEETAKRLKMKIKKKAAGLLKLGGTKEGRKGILSTDAEIFEVTPFFHLVEVKKSNGDSLEYQKILTEDIRPALKDIVWVWQGDQQEQSEQQQEIHDQQQEQSES